MASEHSDKVKKILGQYFDPIYVQEFKIPKHSGKVTVFSSSGPAGKILAMSGKWTKEQHMFLAELFSSEAMRAEDGWSKVVEKASQETFGRPYQIQDYKVSGIARSEYSEKRKDQLRFFAYAQSVFKTLAHAHAEAAKLQNRYKLTYASNPATGKLTKHESQVIAAIAAGKQTLNGANMQGTVRKLGDKGYIQFHQVSPGVSTYDLSGKGMEYAQLVVSKKRVKSNPGRQFTGGKVEFANKEDYKGQFYRNNYAVTLSEFGPTVIVNADNEQDALDEAIDYAEKKKYDGLFLSREDEEELESEGNLGDYMMGGNHGRYLSSMNIGIQKIAKPKRWSGRR
jgi:hypothetical protein